jgi:hypothetical protein
MPNVSCLSILKRVGGFAWQVEEFCDIDGLPVFPTYLRWTYNKLNFMCKPLSINITGKYNFKPIDWYTTENVSHRWKEGHVKKLVRRGFGKTKMDVKVWMLDSPINL